MRFLYTSGIRLYSFVIHFFALFNPKAKDWVNGRKNLWKSLPNVQNREVFWFHCASLGEFDQGLPLMNRIRQEKPDVFLLVTFFSPSGYNHYHKRQHPADFVCYIPVDTPRNAVRFVNYFQPKSVFFIKYEFWSNHIFELKKKEVKLYSVSTLLRPTHHFFKWYGGFFRNTLKQFDFFFAQNQTTVDLLASVGIKNVLLTGDTRFDRVIENKNKLVDNALIRDFVGNSKSVFIAGSTWQKDEEMLENLINSKAFEKYIIAPHNVDTHNVNGLLSKITVPVVRYSQPSFATANVLIIDTIGQLASAYSYGTIAYVGGGFSGSLHNILEPAVFGLPVIFGPKFSRFPEAQLFIENEIGFSVKDKQELAQIVEQLVFNQTGISAKSVDFVERNRGATEKIIGVVL